VVLRLPLRCNAFLKDGLIPVPSHHEIRKGKTPAQARKMGSRRWLSATVSFESRATSGSQQRFDMSIVQDSGDVPQE